MEERGPIAEANRAAGSGRLAPHVVAGSGAATYHRRRRQRQSRRAGCPSTSFSTVEPPMTTNWFATGAILAAIGVGLGAFGAHGLRSRLTPELLAIFETGVRYHMNHALALLAVAWGAGRWKSPWIAAAGWCFLAGIVAFSGSLYILALTGVRAWGAVTPIGGLGFILGWLALAIGAFRGSSVRRPEGSA
jgi:uncharacterized membrane protein YgdD (TMEM256/DUF423 family)